MKKIFTIASFFILIFLVIGCSSATDSTDEPVIPADPELIHFWYLDVTIPNDIELVAVSATYSAIGNLGTIRFESALSGYPETERMAAMERRNQPTSINYRPKGNGGMLFTEAADSMRAIQVREPFMGDAGENSLILDLPTTDFERAVLSFAAMNENAVEALRFDYSIASGTPQWITTGMRNNQIQQTIVDQYILIEVDFSGIEGVKDNPNFKVRIRFDVLDGTKNLGDRVTFNNFALDAARIRN
tara:strand:+ start:19701 stop:20435 length:735 start_codon:yes stop_codon:yes gene_type:complete